MDESISLYFADGSSDKVYHAQLVAQGDGFMVNFQYGRRGSTLQSGSKTSAPTEYERAKKIYQKLIAEKTGKGYTRGESGAAYQGTSNEVRVSGYVPQLLNPIGEQDVQRYINDDGWVAQEKMDGERRIANKKGAGEVDGINRKGLVIALPMPQFVGLCAPSPYPSFVLDGESIGDTLHVFDALEIGGQDLTLLGFEARFRRLESVVSDLASENVRNGEGIVFKRKDAAYTPGRPASGGDQVKFKFVESASCIVEKTNDGKRSVALSLLDADGKRVPVGNVTIPANALIPEAGQIVEIQYLYAYPGGCLYQPVYLGKRTDIEACACALAQLKYKPVTQGEEDGDEGRAAMNYAKAA